MSVVAIDTASRQLAWVLRTDNGGAIAEERQVAGGRLDVLLAAAIGVLLEQATESIVVLTGPGSYSGVRAGMAAALGAASARGLPLYGVGSLTALAAAACAGDGDAVTAVADAGRGGVYVARFSCRGGGVEQVSSVERQEAAAVAPPPRLVATTAIAGLEVQRVDPRQAVAAAVPLALAEPPLMARGLAATHAEERRGGVQRDSSSR